MIYIKFVSVDAPLIICSGKIHSYPVMNILYSIGGRVIILMEYYIQGCINDLPSELRGKSVTPAVSHLFYIGSDPPILQKLDSVIYVHHTIQLFYLSNCSCPNLIPPMAYLMKTFWEPNIHGWKNLSFVYKYLEANGDMPLIFEADCSQLIKWCANVSFAVHHDMISHN